MCPYLHSIADGRVIRGQAIEMRQGRAYAMRVSTHTAG